MPFPQNNARISTANAPTPPPPPPHVMNFFNGLDSFFNEKKGNKSWLSISFIGMLFCEANLGWSYRVKANYADGADFVDGYHPISWYHIPCQIIWQDPLEVVNISTLGLYDNKTSDSNSTKKMECRIRTAKRIPKEFEFVPFCMHVI